MVSILDVKHIVATTVNRFHCLDITYEAVLIKQIATHTGDVKPPLVVIPHGQYCCNDVTFVFGGLLQFYNLCIPVVVQ